MDSSLLDCVSVFLSPSASSLPNWTGLTGGSDSVGRMWDCVALGTEGWDCRKRLYWTGVYLSKLDSSLLGGGLLGVNVLGWVGDVK